MSDNTQPYNSYNFQPLQLEETTANSNIKTQRISELKRFAPIAIIVAGVLLLILLIFLLFQGKGNTPDGNTGTDSTKAVVLQWWGAFMDPEVIQPLIDDYKSVKPNVTIEYANKWPDITYTEAEDKYKTEINRVLKLNDSVQLPDIFMVNNHWVGDYEKYISASANISYTDFQNTYYPAVITDFGANNKVNGLPLWMDTLAVIYNKEMLANESISTPPTDWSQFKSLAQKLTKKSGNNISQAGFAGGTFSNVSYSFELVNLLLMQNGVNITDTNGQPIFASDTDTITSFNFLSEFGKGTTATWNSDLKNDAAAFLEEDLAMLVSPSYRLRDILKYNDSYNIDISVGISQIPQLAGQDEPIINWGDYWGNVVTLNRPNKDYAWEFLAWLNQPEQLKKLSANVKNNAGYFGLLSPRKDMSSENQNDEYLKAYNDSLPYIKSWYMVNGTKVKAAFIERFSNNNPSSSSINSFQDDIIDIIAAKGKF